MLMSWLNAIHWSLFFAISEWVIRLVMLVVVPIRRSPAAAKGWLLLILFEPWLGLVVYLLIGRPDLPRWRREQLAALPQALAAARLRLVKHPNVYSPRLDHEQFQAVRLAEQLGNLPILGGNSAELLVNYEGNIDRLVADIDAAQNHVHLLFYIFAVDATTARVIDALERAVKRGITCRVLVDSLGTRYCLPVLLPKLTKIGVAVHELLPVGWFRFRRTRLDLRNHRKIAVIDGRIGYTGSQNLVAANFKEGITYEELMVRITGPGVLELQYVFIADWFAETGEVLEDANVFPAPEIGGNLPVQVLPSGPSYPTQNHQRLIVDLIHAAQKRVVMTTPYFVPDDPLLQAMQTAVLRGVQVHLVVSAKKDQLFVSLAQQSYYDELLEAGVQIHLYKHRFLHAKHLSIDSSVILIGSSNMDIRSFVLNAEIMLLIYDADMTAKLAAEQERYFKHCTLLTLEKWDQRPFFSKVAQNLARLMSPLL
jgi:cardiolipin synthase A/B